MFLQRLFLLCFLALSYTSLDATHNRAGEIIIKQAEPCGRQSESAAIRAEIITYTDLGATTVDRDSLIITWGDGTQAVLARRSETLLGSKIKRSVYSGFHMYQTPGRYIISFVDRNRVPQILNINNGSSVIIPFGTYTVHSVSGLPLQGCNNSPQLSQIPIESACTGTAWTHNPGAFDLDGDSLAFEFTAPQSSVGVPVPNYILPNELPGAGGELTVNALTGEILWDSPGRAGEYNLAIMVKSFRDGIPLDTLIRDMQVLVSECSHTAPLLGIGGQPLRITPGETVEFDVTARTTLKHNSSLVQLRASGLPFNTTNPATFLPDDETLQASPINRRFSWRPTCGDISDQPHLVFLRAEDNFFNVMTTAPGQQAPYTAGISSHKSVRILVMAPPPANVTLDTTEDKSIIATWDIPSNCREEQNPRFIGTRVYRKLHCISSDSVGCNSPTVDNQYRALIDIRPNTTLSEPYTYKDTTAESGQSYCYVFKSLHRRVNVGTGVEYGATIESAFSTEACISTTDNTTSNTPQRVTQSDFKVYPNPTSGFIHLPSVLSIHSVAVFDNSGRMVLNVDGRHKRLDLTGLKAGLYFLKAETAVGVVTRRVIVR